LRVQLEGDNQDEGGWRREQTALHGHKLGGSVAVVESQEVEDEGVTINLVQGGHQRGNNRRGSQRGGLQGNQDGGQQQGGSESKPMTPSEAAAAAASIG